MGTHDLQAQQNIVVFELGGYTCALLAEHVPELLLMPALTRSPGQPPILDGFLNLRGTAVPALPLHRLFNLPVPEPGLYTPIMLVQSAGGMLAYRVDRLEEVVSIDPSTLQPYTANDTFNSCAEAQFSMQGRRVVLLSADRLLLAKERECLAEFQSDTQRRMEEFEADRS
jgi:purine-binding chemotaxis protein CheW